MAEQSLRKRARIFSPLVLLEISKLVGHGLGAAEIAERIGCSIGTLRVKCSQHGISLRRCCEDSEIRPTRIPHARIVIQLGRGAALGLQQKAEIQGTTGPRLAAALIEAIVQDNLYDAVIDRDTVSLDTTVSSLALPAAAVPKEPKKSN